MTQAVIGTVAAPEDSPGESWLCASGRDLCNDNRTPADMTYPAMNSEPGTAASASPARSRRFRPFSRFRRAQDGTTAVEFAFIAIPFLMVLAAIIETAMIFWTSQILEEAASQTSRRLLTGESHRRYTGDGPANTIAFKNDVCAAAPTIPNCSELIIDVRTYTSFADAKTGVDGSNPISAGGLNTTGFGFNQYRPQQIVVVRAVLPYSLYFTTWNSSLANIGSGRRGIVASMTFRAEPFNVPAVPAT